MVVWAGNASNQRTTSLLPTRQRSDVFRTTRSRVTTTERVQPGNEQTPLSRRDPTAGHHQIRPDRLLPAEVAPVNGASSDGKRGHVRAQGAPANAAGDTIRPPSLMTRQRNEGKSGRKPGTEL